MLEWQRISEIAKEYGLEERKIVATNYFCNEKMMLGEQWFITHMKCLDWSEENFSTFNFAEDLKAGETVGQRGRRNCKDEESLRKFLEVTLKAYDDFRKKERKNLIKNL